MSEEKTFTQEQVNQMISERVRGKDQEIAQLTQERDSLRGQLDIHRQRLISSAAGNVAKDLGVRQGATERLLRLADLEGVSVSESADVDTEALRSAMSAVVEDVPEFREPRPRNVGGGSNPGSGGDHAPSLTREQLRRMSAREIAALPQHEVDRALRGGL